MCNWKHPLTWRTTNHLPRNLIVFRALKFSKKSLVNLVALETSRLISWSRCSGMCLQHREWMQTEAKWHRVPIVTLVEPFTCQHGPTPLLPSLFMLLQCYVNLVCATSCRWGNVGKERMSSILLKLFRVNPDIGRCGRWYYIYMPLLLVQVGQLPTRVPQSCSWIFCTFCLGTPTLWRLYPPWKNTRYIHTNQWFSACPCDLSFEICGMVIRWDEWLE